ncbi:MAG TPA: arginase family protein [Candidatus Pacearchaeota archaeon]|nr:arginase family protein [Candidatus Pacearchaeota archaeon]
MFVVKIPGINGLGKTAGCEKAGNAIINSLREIYSSEVGNPINVDNLDFEEIHLDNKNLKLTNKLIYKNSFEIYETKPKVVFLGGDHSVSYSTTRAFLDYCDNFGKKPCLIVFDMHPNCMKSPEEPNNITWLRKLIEDGFPSENILLVGIRNSHESELEFLKVKKIKTISLNSILLDIEGNCDSIMEFSNGKELYVSIDMGVIDPVFAPAAGYESEVGGLTSREFIYLIQRINKIKNLRAVDIVEINPNKDKDSQTIKLGAKILGEIV